MTTRGRRVRWSSAAASCALAAVAACGGGEGPAAAPGGDGPSGTVLVFAAASLTDAFGEIEAAFEDERPTIDVELNLGASSSLREQVLQGAPADVFAAADRSTMDQVVEAGAVAGRAVVFATNVLEIAVPEGNPAGVAGLADLGRDELLVGLCAQDVPCGELGRQVLAAAGVEPARDTDEPDVRALLTKLEAGELDVGIVYRTDVLAVDAVDGIPIPDEVNVVAEYPIARLDGAPNPGAADAFVAFVLGEEGQQLLAASGFTPA